MLKYTKQQYEDALKQCDALVDIVDKNTPKDDANYIALDKASAIVVAYQEEHSDELCNWRWWDTLRIKFVYPVRDFWYFVCRLCKDKYQRQVIKEAIHGFAFDYNYLYFLEYEKLKEMLHYHEVSTIPIADEERKRIKETLGLAVRLLDIVINVDKLYDFKCRSWFSKKQDVNSCRRWNMFDDQYICKVRVNTRNGKRFCDPTIYERELHELYVEKARHLYHLVRYRYEYLWFD